MKPLADFDFTQRKMEANEELDAVAWAENNGWLVRKIQYIGRVGCPDRLFAGYGTVLLVEMKKPDARKRKGGGLSKGQAGEIERFAAAGVTIHVCYTAEEVLDLLKRHMPSEQPVQQLLPVDRLLTGLLD